MPQLPIVPQILKHLGMGQEDCSTPAGRAVVRFVERYAAPFVVHAAPACEQTRDVEATLATTDEQTTRVRLLMPPRVILLGFSVSVVASSFTAAPFDPNHLLVSLDLNEKDELCTTERDGAATRDDARFALLGSIDRTVRLYHLPMEDKTQIGFQFRSRYATSGASNLGAAVTIRVSTLFRGF